MTRTENMNAETAAVTLSRTHDSVREGAKLGFVVATIIWAWLAMVDVVAGEPFHSFAVLGGTAWFTVVHYLLNVTYGVIIVSTIHGAAREPSLLIALAFGFLTIEIAFAMGTVLLSHLGLGSLAWVRIFGGSVLGAAGAFVLLTRRYPLVSRLRDADEHQH
jgi:hypothetical protein